MKGTKVCNGKYVVQADGKFSVFGNSYNTATLTEDQANYLIFLGWDGIKKVVEKPAEEHTAKPKTNKK
jgi:hypothetical protein